MDMSTELRERIILEEQVKHLAVAFESFCLTYKEAEEKREKAMKELVESLDKKYSAKWVEKVAAYVLSVI